MTVTAFCSRLERSHKSFTMRDWKVASNILSDPIHPEPAHQPNSWLDRLQLVLRRSDQVMIALLLTVSLVGIGIYTWRQSQIRNGLIDVDKASYLSAEYKVDVNTADWPEFSNLPGIGEGTARNIIRYRTQHGPFQSAEELKLVRGIGARKLESIQPYLICEIPVDSNPSR